ncbi:hypothetical protein Tco_0937088 [Tanacetum coccineum]|uniref:Ycf1 n=1 Tax=Tanacetum coccineum TaxID=301880 RepID=A0ABQ5DE71_9ASTR
MRNLNSLNFKDMVLRSIFEEDYRNLVQERFKDHPLEGHDLDLWRDLRMIFDPNEEDDIWLNQQYWELLRWKLHEYSGVHSLFLDGTSIQINMLVEKKYPLKKEILEKMINLKIEAEEERKEAKVFERILSKSKSFNSRNLRFEECYKVVTDRLDWTNPEGHKYPFDLSKPLPLIEDQGHQVVPANYFINNDLEYLKGRSSSRKYTTSTTKTKAAKYDAIEGVEDMVPSL